MSLVCNHGRRGAFIPFAKDNIYRKYAVKLGCAKASIASNLHTVGIYKTEAQCPEKFRYSFNARISYAVSDVFTESGIPHDCFEAARDFIQMKLPVSITTFDDLVMYYLDPDNLVSKNELFRHEYQKLISQMAEAINQAGLVRETSLNTRYDSGMNIFNTFLGDVQNMLNSSKPEHPYPVIKISGENWLRRRFRNEVRIIELEKIVKEYDIITNLERLTKTGVIYRDENDVLSELPYELHGEGFVSLLRLLCVMQEAKEGVLLIEEPENHMHPGYLRIFSEQVMNFAQKLNVQVFITTHSSDLINEFARYPMSDEEENLIQISNIVHRSGEHEIYNYSPGEAKHTIDELLIDLRGT